MKQRIEDLICQYADMREVEEGGLEYAHCTIQDIKCYNYFDNEWCEVYQDRRKGR